MAPQPGGRIACKAEHACPRAQQRGHVQRARNIHARRLSGIAAPGDGRTPGMKITATVELYRSDGHLHRRGGMGLDDLPHFGHGLLEAVRGEKRAAADKHVRAGVGTLSGRFEIHSAIHPDG